MKNAIHTISGMAVFLTALTFAAAVHAGVALEIDNAHARKVNDLYEVDVYFRNSGGTDTIKSLLLSLIVQPASGTPATSDLGVQFVGLINPASDSLFNDPEIGDPLFDDAKLTIASSLVSKEPIPATSDRKAFTALLRSTTGADVDVQVGFLAGFYEKTRVGNEGAPLQIDSLTSIGSFHVSAVPEPSSCVLAATGLAGILMRRRHLRRSRQGAELQ